MPIFPYEWLRKYEQKNIVPQHRAVETQELWHKELIIILTYSIIEDGDFSLIYLKKIKDNVLKPHSLCTCDISAFEKGEKWFGGWVRCGGGPPKQNLVNDEHKRQQKMWPLCLPMLKSVSLKIINVMGETVLWKMCGILWIKKVRNLYIWQSMWDSADDSYHAQLRGTLNIQQSSCVV